jgi:hypothetical protein
VILRPDPPTAPHKRSQRVVVDRMRRVQPPPGQRRIAAGEASRLHYVAQRYVLQQGKYVSLEPPLLLVDIEAQLLPSHPFGSPTRVGLAPFPPDLSAM